MIKNYYQKEKKYFKKRKYILFKYDIKITSLSNSQGIIGGGLNLTINGQGFSSESQVLICNNTCKVYDASLNSISCTVR